MHQQQRQRWVLDDFGTSLVATLFIFIRPNIVYILNRVSNRGFCLIHNCPAFVPTAQLFTDPTAYLMVIGWILFQAFLARLPIGRIEYGHPGLHNLVRLPYRCNGIHAGIISIVLFYYLMMRGYYVTIIYDKLLELMVSTAVIAGVLSLALYLRSGRPGAIRSDEGNTGICVYDFTKGRELNPRICTIDLKFFMQSRPGMIGWVMINLSFLAKGQEINQFMSIALLMTVFSQTVYVLYHLYNESTLISNTHTVQEGLGYELICTHLVWVPFVYTLSTRYLLEHDHLPAYGIYILTVLVTMIGFNIWKSGTWPLTDFLRNRRYEILWTRMGDQLMKRRNRMTSRWCMVRYPEFLGQIILAVAWGLPCGVSSYMMYLYPLYIAVTIIIRERRIDALCTRRYGVRYQDYCHRMRYHIIPRIY